MDKMTPKQKRFCDEYLIDLNVSRAAIAAGYSEKTAYAIGQENLKKPVIKKFLQERMESKEEVTIASQDEVLKYLTSVLRSEATGTTLVGIGQGAQEPLQLTPTVAERTKAAELLGKRYGLYVDKQQIEHSGSVVFADDIEDD